MYVCRPYALGRVLAGCVTARTKTPKSMPSAKSIADEHYPPRTVRFKRMASIIIRLLVLFLLSLFFSFPRFKATDILLSRQPFRRRLDPPRVASDDETTAHDDASRTRGASGVWRDRKGAWHHKNDATHSPKMTAVLLYTLMKRFQRGKVSREKYHL